MEKISGLAKFFLDIWNYKIAVVDKNAITFGTILIGIFVLSFGIYISKLISRKLIHRLLQKTGIEKSYIHTLETITFYLFVVIFTLFAMKMANIPITIFTVIGGAFAIGVGFGSQNIINNFISGIILMVERPIKVGDYIEVDGSYGMIEDIGTRSTTINTPGNLNLIVPNSFFLDKKVINYTHFDKIIRGTVRVGVSYGSDVKKVEMILMEVAKTVPRVISSKPPVVWFQDFGDNALIFDINVWMSITEISQKTTIESNLRYEIYERFHQEGLVIAYPQRDVHLDTLSPLQIEIKK